MAISKVIYKSSASAQGVTWIDATPSTAAAADILSPKTAMLANGVVTQGTGSGASTPTGNINITQAGVTDVTNYATATVPNAIAMAGILTDFVTESNQRKWRLTATVFVDPEDGGRAGWIAEGVADENIMTFNAVPVNTTIIPSTSAQTIGGARHMMEGPVTIAAMPSGTTTAPTSISGTSATVSTGTNTLTLTKTVSVTPRVTTAGYVSAGTAGNSSVSLTASVTTKAAATYNVSSSNQTISASQYLTGAQTIRGVTTSAISAANIKAGVTVKVGDSADDDRITAVTGTFTSDANATAADIVSGKSGYVNGSKIDGSLVVQNYYTGSSAPASNLGSNGDLYFQTTGGQ